MKSSAMQFDRPKLPRLFSDGIRAELSMHPELDVWVDLIDKRYFDIHHLRLLRTVIRWDAIDASGGLNFVGSPLYRLFEAAANHAEIELEYHELGGRCPVHTGCKICTDAGGCNVHQ